MSRMLFVAILSAVLSLDAWGALPCCSSTCAAPNLLDTSQCACCCDNGTQCTTCCNAWPPGQNRQRCFSSCFAEFPAQPYP